MQTSPLTSDVLQTPVCGIGASAGGVEALQHFFQALPTPLGLAYVVIVHLAPDRKSDLTSIIAHWTTMPVVQVGDEEQVSLQADHVYVIAPDRKLELTDRGLKSSTFEERRGQRLAIDVFFRSFAATHAGGFAVILSGTGSDGALGAKTVKACGGLILVQDPDEAAHGDMPRSVIATGVADVVLPAKELAVRLAELARSKQQIVPIVRAADGDEEIPENEERALEVVLDLLRKKTGHDFSRYTRTTILRRLSRRLQLTQQLTIAAYSQYLRTDPQEAQALFDDLLISVTAFFRDPDTWTEVQNRVVRALVERAGEQGEQIRVWVPGCSTGEEAYTLAILFHEEFERRGIKRDLVIFASDVDEAALAVAREGIYPHAISEDLSEARLERYFRPKDDHYRIVSELRAHVVFAVHNLLRDPPFSHLDLISCRNLLIYLDRGLQEQVMTVFSYACRDDAYLILGASENASDELFQPVDRKHRIFTARPRAIADRMALPNIFAAPGDPMTRMPHEGRVGRRASAAEMHMAALEAAAPPSVLIDERWNVLHISPSAPRFLQQSGGPPARQVTELVRPELRDDLHALLHRAGEESAAQLSPFNNVTLDGTVHRVAMVVQPRARTNDAGTEILVTFLDAGRAPDEAAPLEQGETNGQIRALREQVRDADRRIKALRDEHYLTNEDLRAANEELQSINEEYRSNDRGARNQQGGAAEHQ